MLYATAFLANKAFSQSREGFFKGPTKNPACPKTLVTPLVPLGNGHTEMMAFIHQTINPPVNPSVNPSILSTHLTSQSSIHPFLHLFSYHPKHKQSLDLFNYRFLHLFNRPCIHPSIHPSILSSTRGASIRPSAQSLLDLSFLPSIRSPHPPIHRPPIHPSVLQSISRSCISKSLAVTFRRKNVLENDDIGNAWTIYHRTAAKHWTAQRGQRIDHR